jgi:hypothetical protein
MRTLLVLVAMLASFSTWAQDDNRSYVGVSAGSSDSGGYCQTDDDFSGRTRCTGMMLLRVFGGHNFNPHFALEAALVAAERTEGGFMEVAAVGTAPLNDHVAFYGRVGGAFTDRASSGRALALAAGVRFHLGENFGLRFEWQRYSADSSIELLSAGVFVRF